MKNVIVTVDTEGHVGSDPIRHLIWGETKSGKKCGIPLIMDLCDEYGAKAIFFVDMAEAWDYGEDKIAEVIQYIATRGHEVGVHIHPDHMADPKKLFLFEYSRDEQYEIIEKCTNLYKKLLGVQPRTFRAGKYGANHTTLDILSELGSAADFSEFYGYDKWCGIKPAVTGDQTVKLKNGLIEIPTMSYENHFGTVFHRYDKLDTNMSLIEQKYVLSKLIDAQYVDTIVLFAHSFSFLNWRRFPNNPEINKKEVKRFKNMLSIVSKNACLHYSSLEEIITRQYEEIKQPITPTISGAAALAFYLLKGMQVIRTKWEIKRRRL